MPGGVDTYAPSSSPAWRMIKCEFARPRVGRTRLEVCDRPASTSLAGEMDMATKHDPPGPGEGGWSAGPMESRPPTPSHRFRLPRWRIFTWIILAFNILMLIWVVSAIASHASTCHGLTGDALTNCEATNVGVGLAATLLFVFWALGDVILGVLWLITRPQTRACPVCGDSVKRGMTQCSRCGYDFAQQFRVRPPTTGWGQPVPPTQPQPKQSGKPPDWREG